MCITVIYTRCPRTCLLQFILILHQALLFIGNHEHTYPPTHTHAHTQTHTHTFIYTHIYILHYIYPPYIYIFQKSCPYILTLRKISFFHQKTIHHHDSVKIKMKHILFQNSMNYMKTEKTQNEFCILAYCI